MSFKQRLDELERVYWEGVHAVAEDMRERLLIPACDKHGLNFMAGNGTWFLYFVDDEGNEHSVESWESEEHNIKNLEGMKELLAALRIDVGEYNDLGSLTNDYTPGEE